jgi:hypothetical protein
MADDSEKNFSHSSSHSFMTENVCEESQSSSAVRREKALNI